MAIIRNDRSVRREPEPREDAEPEEEIDYTWHPNEDEFVSPLTSEQWAELLSDPAFAESDAARAVRCLFEYGGPATFQQLSIRYRGTMGRYRRWLSDAAHAAGDRYGVPAPQQDQFGMDEWWPLLYCVRNTGKPGAGIQEMLLRPEVRDAFEVIAEQERQAKRAENARNLKRIEQLERARQEERERRAAEAAERAHRLAGQRVAREEDVAQADPVEDEPATQEASVAKPAPVEPVPPEAPAEVVDEAPDPSPVAEVVVSIHPDSAPSPLFAMRKFLNEAKNNGADGLHGAMLDGFEDVVLDVSAPVDYALRYAERLRHAFALVHEGMPRFSAAMAARALGDESMEVLQSVLNGQTMPPFAYLDSLRDHLFVNVERLEACEGQEDALPAFCALDELMDAEGVLRALAEGSPSRLSYVTNDAKRRRRAVIVVRFAELRCALLSRTAVTQQVAEELESFARREGVAFERCQIPSPTWDSLVSGRIWPGSILR